MNCPRCRRKMEYLRSISNQAKGVGFYLCGKGGQSQEMVAGEIPVQGNPPVMKHSDSLPQKQDLHAPCGTVLVCLGNPSRFLGFWTDPAGPPSPFSPSLSHEKVARKKRDLRSMEVHAARIRKGSV